MFGYHREFSGLQLTLCRLNNPASVHAWAGWRKLIGRRAAQWGMYKVSWCHLDGVGRDR